MAATASDTATMKVSRIISGLEPSSEPWRMRSTAKMITQIASTSLVRMPESSLSLIWSGVSSFLAVVSASAILPISVFMPVAATTALPRP